MDKAINLLDILKNLAEDAFDERRKIEDNYIEFVVNNSYSGQLNTILYEHFGDPLKESGRAVTPEMKKITENYGGVQKNQVLYYACIGSDKVIVMLWPWQDNQRTTVKIIRIGGNP